MARMFRPFRSGALMQWFMDYFTRAGITVIPVHEPPQSMAKRLKNVLENNGIVVLLVDEPTPTPSALVPFFDSAIKMPLGPVRLARATGSVIVPTIASYEPGRKMKIRLAEPQSPQGSVKEEMNRLAGALETLVSENLNQWAMLTPIWIDEKPGTPAPPDGHSYADLHLHTQGSDGLLHAEEWSDAARDGAVRVIAVTDHDHIETVRAWKLRDPESTRHVIPGVELTARGRIVHLGVLFPGEMPPAAAPGTPLLDLVRWARGVEGSIVILVHPLPGLWRRQLRGMARVGLLPDAIEADFPSAAIAPRQSNLRPASTGSPFLAAVTLLLPVRSAQTPRCSQVRRSRIFSARSATAGRGPLRCRVRAASPVASTPCNHSIPGSCPSAACRGPAVRTMLLRRARATAQRGERRKDVVSVQGDSTRHEVQVS